MKSVNYKGKHFAIVDRKLDLSHSQQNSLSFSIKFKMLKIGLKK